MAGTIVEPPRQTMARITLDPSAAAARPAAEERQGEATGRQEDRQTDGEERVGEGEIRGGTSPAGALAP